MCVCADARTARRGGAEGRSTLRGAVRSLRLLAAGRRLRPGCQGQARSCARTDPMNWPMRRFAIMFSPPCTLTHQRGAYSHGKEDLHQKIIRQLRDYHPLACKLNKSSAEWYRGQAVRPDIRTSTQHLDTTQHYLLTLIYMSGGSLSVAPPLIASYS